MANNVKMCSKWISRLCRLRLTGLQKLDHISVKSLSSASNAVTIETAEYPPVKPRYPPGKWGEMTEKLSWQLYEKGQSLRDIPKVKERLESISGDKNIWMWTVEALNRLPISVQYKQYITKTHIEQGLPKIYDNVAVDNEILKNIKECFNEVLLQQMEYHYNYKLIRGRHFIRQHQQREYNAHNFLGQVLNLILPSLYSSNLHLLQTQIDESVRLETFWWCGGFEDNEKKPAKGKKDGILKMQLKDKISYQIRHELPLNEFVSVDDELSTKGSIAALEYSPKAYGQREFLDRPITVSGHWIDDPCEFGLLTLNVLPTNYDRFSSECGQQYAREEPLQYAMVKSFGSCVAQAHNQGFNVYDDVTYPFTTQTVVTNGQWFQFFAYQLNTFQLWKDSKANPRNNIMWCSERMNLYDTIEGGKVHGLNDAVLRQLVKCFMLKPVDRGINLRPYLPLDPSPAGKEKYINDVGEEPLPHEKIGRWQYPRNAVYF